MYLYFTSITDVPLTSPLILSSLLPYPPQGLHCTVVCLQKAKQDTEKKDPPFKIKRK